MYDLVVSYKFHFRKKNTESSVIFIRNGVSILNRKENKEATVICFEIRIPKKIRNYYRKSHLKFMEKKKNWFINISEYHPRAMGLQTKQ